jgi:N-acylneuraminate cytidylyltransferase
MKTEVLALIPARGGSKGLPRKNVRELAGKPLIAYSIETALASRWITRTIVSTDDPEIAEAAKRFGAEVPFIRPAEFAQDHSLDIEVFRHALEWLEKEQGYRPELVVHLRPTCPIRNVQLVDRAIQALIDHPEGDSIRSVSLPEQTPYKMWRIEGDWMKPLLEVPGEKEHFNLPRQKLPRVYWQNGYVDVTRPRNILERNGMSGSRILPLIVDEEWVDIDYEESLHLAEKMLGERSKDGGSKTKRERHSS